jgi:putative DNA primase/helicase
LSFRLTEPQHPFRFDDQEGRGTFICEQCDPKAGDGFDLVMKVNGWEFKEAARRVEELIGSAPFLPSKPKASEEDKRRGLRALWANTTAVGPDDHVARWLRMRVGLVSVPSCLRSVERMIYTQHDQLSWHPGMVALLVKPNGEPDHLHRTYLTPDGQKAPVFQPRLMMLGPLADGVAVPLFPEYDGVLGIAEGIETAFAAAALFNVPCWAATNSTILAKWIPPDDVQEVFIFSDNDAHKRFGGQLAAYKLANRLSERLVVRVEEPPNPGEDWNTVLISRGSHVGTSKADA